MAKDSDFHEEAARFTDQVANYYLTVASSKESTSPQRRLRAVRMALQATLQGRGHRLLAQGGQPQPKS